MKKILSLLVVLSIILSCAPVMAQRNISLNGLPDVLEVKYEDSFTAAEKDTRIGLNGAQYDSENGVINLPGANDNVDFYFRKNTTEIAGVYAVDLSLTREKYDMGEVNVVFTGKINGTNATLMNIKWKSMLNTSDNGLYIGNDKIADGIIYNTAKNLKLTVKFDTVSGTSSVWVNEKPAFENNIGYFTKASVQKVRVTKGGTDDNNVKVNDFRLYSVPVAGMPIADDYYSYTEFDKDSENVAADYAVTVRGTSSPYAEKGALYLNAKANDSGVRLYFADSKKSHSGEMLLVEYALSSTVTPSTRKATMNIFDSRVVKSFQNTWNYGNIKINGVTYADSEYGTAYSAKFTYLFDTTARKYSLWINDKLALSDIACFADSVDSALSLIQILTDTGLKIAVEDVKVGVVRDFAAGKYNLIAKEEFNSESELNSNPKISLYDTTSTYSWGQGYVDISTAGTTDTTTRAMIDIGKENIKGNIYVNLTLARKAVDTKDLHTRVWFSLSKDGTGASRENLSRIDWTDVGLLSNSPSPITSAAADNWIGKFEANTAMDMVFKIDTVNGTQSMYINGKEAWANQSLSDTQKSYLNNGYVIITLSTMKANRPLYLMHLEAWQEDGKNAMRITDDNKLELMLNENADNLALYVAGYGGDDSLDKISLETLNLKKGKVYSADITDFSAFSKIKTFLWENNASLKPLVINAEK